MRFFMPLQIIFSLETFVTNLTCEILDIVGGLSVRAYRALRKRWKLHCAHSRLIHIKHFKKENRLYSSNFWSLAKSRSKFFASIWFMDMVVFSLLNTSLLDRDSKTAFETMGISGELSVELSSHEKPYVIWWWHYDSLPEESEESSDSDITYRLEESCFLW